MLVGLLVIAIISLKVNCNTCCESANGQCNLFNDLTRCNGYGSCIWVNDACKEAVCEDYPQSSCSSHSRCKWSGSACTTVNTCSGWGVAECNNEYEYSGDDEKACVAVDGVCKVAVCGDLKNDNECNYTYDVGGKRNGCYWNSGSGTCVDATGCGSFNSTICNSKYWNGDRCAYSDDGECVVRSCSIYKSDSTCTTTYNSDCKWSGSACSAVTSCGDYDQSRCDGKYVGKNDRCHWANNVCHVAVCSDWNGDQTGCESSMSMSGGSSYYNLNCVYSGSTCSAGPPPPGCGTYTTGILCDAMYCKWLSSCPVEDLASVMYVPALLVAFLLAFLL